MVDFGFCVDLNSITAQILSKIHHIQLQLWSERLHLGPEPMGKTRSQNEQSQCDSADDQENKTQNLSNNEKRRETHVSKHNTELV